MDHEHLHFEQMHSGGNEGFDVAYKRAYQRYFTLLTRPGTDIEEAAEPQPEQKEEKEEGDDPAPQKDQSAEQQPS